jgi:hypothetical protein
MKATELRLGNWVFDTMLRKEIQMDFEDFACCENFLKSNHFIPYRPVPLTREWLLKFGLKYSYIDKNKFFMLGVDIYIFNVDKIIFNPSSTFLCVKLEYVHHLQNLYFALKGEELTSNQ